MPDYPILDRKPHFDEESRQFPIRRLLSEPYRKRQRIWSPRISGPLDQGSEGRCTIFGCGGELAATPQRYAIDNAWCNDNWPKVQAEDRKMGNNWSDGASVLAALKAVKNMGKFRYYAWCFGINDVIQAVMRKGPVLLGINWYESMYETNPDGFVTVDGSIVGGHCIMLNGYMPKHLKFGEVAIWTNSWGPSYGINGRGYIRINDLNRLLHEDGEAAIPTDVSVRI